MNWVEKTKMGKFIFSWVASWVGRQGMDAMRTKSTTDGEKIQKKVVWIWNQPHGKKEFFGKDLHLLGISKDYLCCWEEDIKTAKKLCENLKI